jgi:hypothetical protein
MSCVCNAGSGSTEFCIHIRARNFLTWNPALATRLCVSTPRWLSNIPEFSIPSIFFLKAFMEMQLWRLKLWKVTWGNLHRVEITPYCLSEASLLFVFSWDSQRVCKLSVLSELLDFWNLPIIRYSKGSSRVSVSPITWRRKQISFRNFVSSGF